MRVNPIFPAILIGLYPNMQLDELETCWVTGITVVHDDINASFQEGVNKQKQLIIANF